ncbi:hypothetical protein HDU81_008813 [Chytriomyces hyalinus]|nr:hypothetical protein HDU81_008813 [Chytriomyces hyalinus]
MAHKVDPDAHSSAVRADPKASVGKVPINSTIESGAFDLAKRIVKQVATHIVKLEGRPLLRIAICFKLIFSADQFSSIYAFAMSAIMFAVILLAFTALRSYLWPQSDNFIQGLFEQEQKRLEDQLNELPLLLFSFFFVIFCKFVSSDERFSYFPALLMSTTAAAVIARSWTVLRTYAWPQPDNVGQQLIEPESEEVMQPLFDRQPSGPV